MRCVVLLVMLLNEVIWTSTVTEQQHASLALLRRFHPEYLVATLCARALVLQLRKLLPHDSELEKKLLPHFGKAENEEAFFDSMSRRN